MLERTGQQKRGRVCVCVCVCVCEVYRYLLRRSAHLAVRYEVDGLGRCNPITTKAAAAEMLHHSGETALEQTHTQTVQTHIHTHTHHTTPHKVEKHHRDSIHRNSQELTTTQRQ